MAADIDLKDLQRTLTASAKAAGGKAVASGKWLSEWVVDNAPRIPVRDVLDVVPPYLSVNTTVLQGLKAPWRVPDDVLREANVVVDETGVRRKAADARTTSQGARQGR